MSMTWLRILLALMILFSAAFGASFLDSAWRRRKKSDPAAAAVEAALPGYDCGLCGFDDCLSYSTAISAARADPGLCSPGGTRTRDAIRSRIVPEDDPRRLALKAVVRCGGTRTLAAKSFGYDGREHCASAAALYGGPSRCKEGCIGLGTCASACRLGAIRMEDGLARIDAEICTGCGDCVDSCPTRIIALVPESTGWLVACSSRRGPEAKLRDCGAACTACGECVRRSRNEEFVIDDNLAFLAVRDVGTLEPIASKCPTGAIIRSGSVRKNPRPPSAAGRADI
jgi:electron transport complex protein RnfB